MLTRIGGTPLAAWFLISHAIVLLAGFVAPYDPVAQNRMLPFAPPSRIHFFHPRDGFSLRPFIHGLRSTPTGYEEDPSVAHPLRFFAASEPYRLAGFIEMRRRLMGVDEPGRIFLLGSDEFGRDQLSRLLHGGQISLLAGLLASALALGLGLALGAFSGFYGGWPGELVMRFSELFLALPWLYLLFGVRAFLPLSMNPAPAFLVLTALIGAVSWARPARLIRAVVLSARDREFVQAARGFGASEFYLLVHHVLPATRPVLLVQATVLLPHAILAEVTLSFFGLGVAEPAPSWGSLLASARQLHVLAEHWWMILPCLFLLPIFLGYYRLADAMQMRVDRGSAIR